VIDYSLGSWLEIGREIGDGQNKKRNEWRSDLLVRGTTKCLNDDVFVGVVRRK
jgi:hypothetical protein